MLEVKVLYFGGKVAVFLAVELQHLEVESSYFGGHSCTLCFLSMIKLLYFGDRIAVFEGVSSDV